MSSPKSAAIYTRISEDRDGEMLGVTRQLKDCEAYAGLKGWIVAEHYCDDDVSAYGSKPRPAYQRLLADLRNGQRDAVLVWHLDRLHRHPKELEAFFDICDGAGIRHLATVTGDVDLATHDGRFHARILSAVARKESDDKSRRTTRKHLEIAQNGRWAGGKRPYGYSVDRHVIAEEAAIIREAAKRLLAGESLMSVAKDLNRRGVPTARGATWSDHALKSIVIHPRLAGLRTLHDRVVGPAVWDAILDSDDSKRLHALLTDPARNRSRTARKYLLSGLLFCQLCGTKLQSHPNRGKPSYACVRRPGYSGCGGIAIGAGPLEAFITEAVLTRLDSPQVADAMKHQPANDQEAADLEIAIARDQAKLEELAGLWADEKLDTPEYLVARKRITERLDAAKRQFSRVDRHASLRRVVVEAQGLRGRWADLNLDQRRVAISAILDRVVVSRANRGRVPFDPARLEPTWKV